MLFLPEGSQDETGQILDNKATTSAIFREIAQARNFKAIATPVVEYATTFTNKHVGMKLHRMLKWFNRDGEIEVLRVDWTTAIARALMKQQSPQTKWFYEGSVFRNDKDGIESKQAGIEIIRTEAFLGEVESLLTAVAYLKELGISNYLIELGHTGIFDEIVASLNLDEADTKKLREAMHDKRRDIVYEIALAHGTEKQVTQLTQLVDAYGSVTELRNYQSIWKDNPKLTKILDHLIELANLLKQSGVDEVIIDLGRVKNLPYYSGTMFRGYVKTDGETCFSGGRYDKLYEQFDEKISAVGLAFDVDVLAKHLQQVQAKPHICILADSKTHVQAEQLRASYSNAVVDIQYEQVAAEQYDKIVTVDNEIIFSKIGD